MVSNGVFSPRDYRINQETATQTFGYHGIYDNIRKITN